MTPSPSIYIRRCCYLYLQINFNPNHCSFNGFYHIKHPSTYDLGTNDAPTETNWPIRKLNNLLPR